MEKHSNQIDLDEWEVLSDDGFFELHHHDTRSSSKKVLTIDSGFDDYYFICPSPKKSVVPVTTIQLEPNKEEGEEEEQIVVVKEMIKVPIVEIKTPKKLVVLVGGDDDQDTISQVFFFNKMKENEFVDMKLDSPKSSVTRGGIKFEDKEEVTENEKKIDDQEEAVVKNYLDSDMMKRRDQTSLEGGGGLQIWKWRITGIGALCSMGIITAATTICIFIIGNRKKKKHHQQQNQKYRIQIYAEDQRIKHVVHHATKLNHAIAAARGVPLTRGHLTFGGYFDGL